MSTLDGRSANTADDVLLKELASRVEAADVDSRVEVTNAMTGRPLGEVPRCTSDDVAAAAQRARAVQPVLRKQRAGHVITISSVAGVIGQEFCAAYAASKFGVEGWMESLRFDVEPYNIRTTIVEPGFFRTELLMDFSTTWPELSIEDYAPRTAQMIEAWKSQNGSQQGDPAKLARALMTIAEQGDRPLRFVAGADAIDAIQDKAEELLKEAQASRELAATWPTTTPLLGRYDLLKNAKAADQGHHRSIVNGVRKGHPRVGSAGRRRPSMCSLESWARPISGSSPRAWRNSSRGRSNRIAL